MSTVPPSDPPPAPKRRKTVDIAGFFSRRGAFTGITGALLAVVLIPLLMLVIKPKYAASAALMVDASKEVAISGKERDAIPGEIGDYTRTQIGRMKNVGVLIAALRSIPATNRPSFCDPKGSEVHNAIELMKHLTIADTPRAYLITARIEAEEPRGLGDTLNAVMDTFLTKLRGERERQNENRITYLRSERARIQEMITDEHKRLLEQASRLSNKAFLHQNYSVHINKLEQIQRLHWEAEADRVTKEGAMNKAIADAKQLQALSLQPYADERVADNFGINRIEQYTYEQLQQMRATVDGLTPDNQDRKYVEQRMRAMNDYLDTYKKTVNESTTRNLVEKRAYDLNTEIIKASTAYDAAKQKVDQLAKELAVANTEASATSEAIFNASDITYSITQLRDRLSALNTRIDDCEMESKAPLKILIDNRAANPSLPTTNTRPRVFAMGVILAYMLVLIFCLIFELLDNRVRSRRELETAIGGEGPEPVPLLNGREDETFNRVVRDAPRNLAAQSLRSLAVRIERERKTHHGSVILISGANRKTGATAVACNLADALAGIAERVLLVELCAASVDNPAAADALADEHPLRGVTRQRLLSTSPDVRIRLRHLLQRAKDTFHFILIDTAPLQSDDLAQLAALESDAAIVIAREDHTAFRDVVAALDVLRGTKIPAMTVLLNFATRDCRLPRPTSLQRNLARVTRAHQRLQSEILRRWTVRKQNRTNA